MRGTSRGHFGFQTGAIVSGLGRRRRLAGLGPVRQRWLGPGLVFSVLGPGASTIVPWRHSHLEMSQVGTGRGSGGPSRYAEAESGTRNGCRAEGRVLRVWILN